jgi:hypothetical protein
MDLKVSWLERALGLYSQQYFYSQQSLWSQQSLESQQSS